MLMPELLAAAALWVAAGMTAVSVLYRRGHDGWWWFAVGALAGPLTGLFVADQARYVEPEVTPARVGPLPRTPGGVVVVAPSRLEELDAVAAAVDRIAPSGPVEVVTALPYEAKRAPQHDRHLDAVADLDRAVARLVRHQPSAAVLYGPLSDAVVGHAVRRSATAVVLARGAHRPSCQARIAGLATRTPGVTVVLADPTLAPLTPSAAAEGAA